MTLQASNSQRIDGRTLAALIGIVGASLGLNIASAMGDLWIDEVWSLLKLPGADIDWLAFRSFFFHDNNHPVTSLYLWLVGDGAPPVTHRGLSVASGTGSVIVGALIGLRRSPAHGVLAALALAVSYPLVHYAGEARGYAPLMLCALACFDLFERYLERPRPALATAFGIVSIVGLFSHMGCIFVMSGLGAWGIAHFYRERASIRFVVLELVKLFAAPAVVFGLYLVLLILYMTVNGTPPLPSIQALAILTALGFGLDGYWLWPLGAAVWGLLAGALAWQVKARRREAIFFVIVVFYLPACLVVVEFPPDPAPRYFIWALPFALLLAALSVGDLWRMGGRARMGAVALSVAFVLGNAHLIYKFLDGGRGEYGEAVRIAADHAESQPVEITGYADIRVSALVRHHIARQGLEGRAAYVPRKTLEERAVEWYVAENCAPEPSLIVHGRPYDLAESLPQWGLSGFCWSLYRHREEGA